MQNTTHYNLKKPDYTDFADIQDINDNMDTIDEKLAAPTGDARDQVVSFTDADLDSGITSFPTFLTKIVSGMKLAKFLRDFKAGMGYVLHTGSLINNATCTESGKALDARMGKTLQDQITSLNDSLSRNNRWNSLGEPTPSSGLTIPDGTYEIMAVFYNSTTTFHIQTIVPLAIADANQRPFNTGYYASNAQYAYGIIQVSSSKVGWFRYGELRNGTTYDHTNANVTCYVYYR